MTIHTAGDARAASEHVLYEIEMFCAIAAYFENGVVDVAVRGLQHEGLVVRNAMIEAFQLHARQLIDLLTRTNCRDMSACDFTTTKWRQLKRSQRRQADFDRFSQRVMHLSVNRTAFTATQQRVASRRIRSQLGDDIRRFLDAVDDDRVSDDFMARAHLALTLSEPLAEQVQMVVGATEAMNRYTGGAVIPELPTDGGSPHGRGTATAGLLSNPTP